MEQNLEFTTGRCPNISARIVVTFFFSLCLLLIHFAVDPYRELMVASLWNQRGNISDQPTDFLNCILPVHTDLQSLQRLSSV